MSLPFTAEQFFDVFRQYNTSIWPIQFLLIALAIVAAIAAIRPARRSGPLVAIGLATLWAWTGGVYHWWFFTRVNPAARLFALVWLAGAACFVVAAGRPRAFSFRTAGWRLAVGVCLVAYALVLYPLAGILAGRDYMASPTFGAPCPVAIFTFGVLWLAEPRPPRWTLAAPLLWSAIGSSAVFAFGVLEDLGLAAAGASGLVLLLLPRRPTPKVAAPSAAGA